MAEADRPFEAKAELSRADLAELLRQWERAAKGDVRGEALAKFVVNVIEALPALVKAHKLLDDLCGALAWMQENGWGIDAVERKDGAPMAPVDYAHAQILAATKLGWLPPRRLD